MKAIYLAICVIVFASLAAANEREQARLYREQEEQYYRELRRKQGEQVDEPQAQEQPLHEEPKRQEDVKLQEEPKRQEEPQQQPLTVSEVAVPAVPIPAVPVSPVVPPTPVDESPAADVAAPAPEFDATGLVAILYDDIKFGGASITVACCGTYTLTFGVSSAKIAPGVQAIFSAADDCAEFGDVSSLTSATDTSDFTNPQIGFNDRAKCVRLASDHFYRPSASLPEVEEALDNNDELLPVVIADETVKVFEHRRYGGQVTELKCCGTFNLPAETASSIQIGYGLTVSLHAHEGCPDGNKLLLRNHVSDLSARGFNDVASCARVEREDLSLGITLFSGANFAGERQFLKAGSYLTPDLHWNDKTLSVKIPPSFEVTLYEHNLYQGEKVTLTADTANLTGFNFDLKTSSVVVTTVCVPACVHGLCVNPNECDCNSGWDGDACDKELFAQSFTEARRDEL